MSGVVQDNVASNKQVIYLPFFATDIGDADGTLYGQATTPEYVMPFRGSVVGFSGTLNGTLTTGTLQINPMINGSPAGAFTPAAALMHVNQTGVYYTHGGRKSGYEFQAGARIGATYQKTGTIAPETRDGNFLLIVLQEGVQL